MNGPFLCLLAAVVMAYGWGYRGVVGHEGGAMVPGAFVQSFPGARKEGFPLVEASFIALAAIATAMLLSQHNALPFP